ncbi:MAG: hypothetical protein J6V72_16450, partial [Kiritimatiellae bacterium]|nr:hypothetical protein [Kiritimatiellia bacterium]
ATNAALPVATWRARGHFDVQMSVAAGTNLVQLAFGRDADRDGELSRAETALIVGRGAGEVFVEDVAARMRYAEALPPTAGRRGLCWRVFLNVAGAPTGLIATNEAGVALFTEWRHAPPAWSLDPSWDTVRVVSAGSDDVDGRVRVEIGPEGTLFIMR